MSGEARESGVPVPPHRSGVVPTHGDGYEFIALNERAGWHAVPDWGAEGWDLGRWPTTVVMFSDDYDKPRALLYVEGDTEEREFATNAERTTYIDDVAEQLWRSGEADGPRDVGAYSPGGLPASYRGEAPRSETVAPAPPPKDAATARSDAATSAARTPTRTLGPRGGQS